MNYQTKFSIESAIKEIEKARKANLNLKALAFDDSEKAYLQGCIEAYDYVLCILKNLHP